MDYLELLKEQGIAVNESEFLDIMQPTVATPELVEEEYEHWDWGDHVLRDLNEPGCQHPFALDYHDEIWMGQFKIHRYSRKDRFRFTLFQLLGLSGHVPEKVLEIVRQEIGKYVKSNSKIWNTIRKILKEHGYRKYYNRIPFIIREVAGFKIQGMKKANLVDIFKRFDDYSYKFDTVLKKEWNRSYFPNMRYIALRMIMEQGVEYPYHVPLIRTLRKKKYLSDMYIDFNK